MNLFGSFDENIRLLEQEFSVTVVNREGELRVEGEAEDVSRHSADSVTRSASPFCRAEQRVDFTSP